ncbi:hypothetical protein PACTADRAFT_46062, partial [Pachysolen tannophilus NRRL Y-2460]
EQQELSIQEEYKLWRKNCHYMYDFISETALTWPSLSIQWLPEQEVTDVSVKSKLLLSTHTSGEDINYIKIASTQLPLNIWPNSGKIIKDNGNSNKETKINSRLKIVKKLKQNSEINRVRFMPQDSNIIGSINGSGEVFVYNLSSIFNDNETDEQDVLFLDHHKENGYGLNWNSLEKNYLLTSSDDKSIALWDIGLPPTNKILKPITVINDHTDIVNDVKWNPHNSDLFGSVSDDKSFKYFDKRSLPNSIIDLKVKPSFEINSLSFSSFSKNLFALGGTDNNISLYDLRNTSKSLHQMIGHTGAITSIEWSPTHENIIASGSTDRRVILWDINNIGKELLADEAEDGVPELMFMHGGHTGAINDLSFNPEIPYCIASTSDDNIVHVWKASDKIINDDADYDEIDINELE